MVMNQKSVPYTDPEITNTVLMQSEAESPMAISGIHKPTLTFIWHVQHHLFNITTYTKCNPLKHQITQKA